jgi:hypothetical protein
MGGIITLKEQYGLGLDIAKSRGKQNPSRRGSVALAAIASGLTGHPSKVPV